jgi:hypothetical protein
MRYETPSLTMFFETAVSSARVTYCKLGHVAAGLRMRYLDYVTLKRSEFHSQGAVQI